MTTEFHDHIDKFINSFTNDVPKIHYQAFDFSKVQDNRSKLLNLNFDKQKVSFVNLEMVRRNDIENFRSNFSRIDRRCFSSFCGCSQCFRTTIITRFQCRSSVSISEFESGTIGRLFSLFIEFLTFFFSNEDRRCVTDFRWFWQSFCSRRFDSR